ncbi:DUF2796 domain-containing protein [Candidatus Sororendozoicomonas aggregata]|uniref:DUF2796 domain-containing protein n=1 Tax=Candidatus Sororendozoicomonas aggregata TaxID=3073239 RepID=UPI002ED24F0F
MRVFSFILLGSLSTALATTAQAEIRHHEAHVHGHGELNLAIDNQTLYLELSVPAHDIVGFESIKTDQQQATLDDALKQLETPGLWTLPEAAACGMVSARAIAGHEQHDHEKHNHSHDHDAHEHNHDHDAHQQNGNHMDISATYIYQCTHPKAINQLGTTLFDQFERSETIKVQALTDQGQQSGTLSRKQPKVSL